MVFPLILFFAPESLSILLTRQKSGDLEKANHLLKKLGRPILKQFPDKDGLEEASKLPFLDLLKPDLRTTTVLVWASFIGAIFVVYFLLSWIPKLALNSGYDLETAINGSSIFNTGAIFGLVIVGWIIGRWNIGKVTAILYLLATLVMIIFSQWNSPELVYYSVLFAIGFFQQSGNGALYAIVAQVYDPSVKTTAIGWAAGMGRAGAIAGPAAGGLALSAGISVSWMFVIFSTPMLVTAICALIVGRRHFATATKQT